MKEKHIAGSSIPPVRRRRRARLLAAMCAMCVLWFAGAPHTAAAQDSDTADQLDEVQDQLGDSQSRADDLEQAALELAEETEELSRRLIATAAKIQGREAQVTAAEERLEKLSFEEIVMRGELQSRRDALSELLAGLQRLETDFPPPLAVNPTDALSALRGAMLLGSVVPELRGQANALAQSLGRIADIRTAIVREQSEIAENLGALDVERRQIVNLLEQKQTLTQTITEELETERARSNELAERAQGLNDLIVRLEQARRDAQIARLESEQQRQDELEQERLERIARLAAPQVAFTESRGALSFPAQGTRIRDYGSEDSLGSSAEGMFIETRQFAQVTSANDGWVVYAGTFRGYGKLLIINAGEGYHVLLAGMDQIAVNVGQFVRAGEPVGTMGATAAQSTVIGSDTEDGKPVLYVEFRKNGNAIDPSPWWAGNDERVRG
jgi:septal ring factor EnvC (AmiA/AmiB activator)